jgi:hypothetical protein
MRKIKEFIKEKGMQRRSFLKLAGLSSVGLSLGFPLNTKWADAGEPESRKSVGSWHTDPTTGNSYFVQKNLKTDWVNDATDPHVLAKYDGWWHAYPAREFNDDFHDWWIAEKSWYYDQLIANFDGDETTESVDIPNGGHHHPMLSTYGCKWLNRGDSKFHLNTTPKGFTILPKVDQIDYINEQIQAIYDDPNARIPVDIFKKRRELYQNKDLWDKTRFATLELYTGRPIDAEDPSNQDGIYGIEETHTFQNIMKNPMSTLTYMSLYNTDGTQTWFEGMQDETPTFEFRGFCWLISYYNPKLTDYEKAIADYINQAHCGYHGGSCVISTNIFVITEEFNNSPGYDPYARGKRVVPPPEPGLYTTTSREKIAAARSELKRKNLTKAEKIELLKKMRIPL